jgi:hypothetical protein
MISARTIASAVCISAAAGALAFGAVSLISANDRSKGQTLSQRGIETVGTVTGSFPQDHGTISYTFQDNAGVIRSGGGSVSGANPRPEALSSGSKVQVRYDSQDSAVSCACDPAADLDNARRDNLGLTFFVGFAALILSFAGLTVRRQRGRPVASRPDTT